LDAPLFSTASEGGFQTSQVFKHTQPAQRKRRLAAFGEGGSNQIGIGVQHGLTRVVRGHLVQGTANSVKRATNGLFQGFFEGLVGFHDRHGGIAQAVRLTGLVGHARQYNVCRQAQRLLIVTHPAPHSIAPIFDGSEQMGRQSPMRRREERDLMQDQPESQLTHHVQRPVAFFGLERINRNKETMPTKVRRMLFQTEMIRATQ
jgi:hypothetical protein